MNGHPWMGLYGGIAKWVTRFQSHGGLQSPSSGRGRGRGNALTSQGNYPNPVPVRGTCHTALATFSPKSQPISRPLPVTAFFQRQGGHRTAL